MIVDTPLGPVKVKFKEEVAEDGRMGEWDLEKHKVKVLEDMCLQERQITLMHELLHIGEQVTGQEYTENQIDSMAIYVTYILQRNPELVRYMTQYEE